MKKGLLTSYVAGITDTDHGEGYARLMRYFIPEFISAFLLYSLPFLIDSYFISQLGSTETYATLGATNNFIHFIMKVAESMSVGTVIMTGQFNGMHAYERAGRSLRDSFWVTVFVGFSCSVFLYAAAYYIYVWYGLEGEMLVLGVPFLKTRAIGLFFMFLSMAFIGFLRGIKNTKAPMMIFVIGSIIFVLFDYLLIFGNWGFPALGLQGSAIASIIQYAAFFLLAYGYVLYNPAYRKYQVNLWRGVLDLSYIRKLLVLSWPIILDKATMSWALIWLCKMINPMGPAAIAAFCVVKDIERFAFLPAIAFAQVITFLASNDAGIHEWESIKSNIKKVCFLASIMVVILLLFFSLNPEPIIHFFDKKGEFTALAAHALPILSVLVSFDLVQLILSGALRGSGNVKVVMYVRLAICCGYFVPLSFLLSHLQVDVTLKFILVYGSFYVGNAFMSIAYINRLRSEEWKMPSLKGGSL